MGACETGIYIEEGTSFGKVLDEVVEDARRMYGDDPYNGTITTVSNFRRAKSYAKYSETKARKKEVEQILRKEMERCSKRDGIYIDLGVKYYERIVLKETREKVSAKYKTQYVLVAPARWGGMEDVAHFDTLTRAKEEAMKYYKRGEKCSIEKKPIKISGNETAITYDFEKKTFASRPKEIKGTVAINEIHVYAFAGMAAE